MSVQVLRGIRGNLRLVDGKLHEWSLSFFLSTLFVAAINSTFVHYSSLVHSQLFVLLLLLLFLLAAFDDIILLN